MRNWKEDAVILAALQLGAEKWGSVKLTGSQRFREVATAIAAAHGIKVVNPATIQYDGIHAGQQSNRAEQQQTQQAAPQPPEQQEAAQATPQPAQPQAQQQPAAQQTQAAAQPQPSHSTEQENDMAKQQSKAAPKRIYLGNVPFAHNKLVKQFGGRYDRQKNAWWVPEGTNLAKIKMWQPETLGEQPEPRIAQEDTRLYTAFDERALVAALGGVYIQDGKYWIAPKGSDLNKFEAWLKPQNVAAGKPLRPEVEFGDALRAKGALLDGAPVLDGQGHRLRTVDDKPDQQSFSYRSNPDGSLLWHDFRTGESGVLRPKGYEHLSPEQKAQSEQIAAAATAARKQETAATQERKASELADKLKTYQPVTRQTGYQKAKGIAPTPGSYTNKRGDVTILPAYDAEGKQWTTQYIQADGQKKFATGARKEGTFHPVTGMDSLKQPSVIIIAEGYATAASIAANARPVEKQGDVAVLAAWDAGNLVHVAQAVRNKYPDKPIVIAGDDDLAQQNKSGKNPGRERAEEAARAVDGKAVFPTFASGEQQADPKHRSDFNDLAQNSSLGNQGVARQINAAVRQVVERQEQQAQQQQAQQQAQQAQQQEAQQQQDVHQQHVQQQTQQQSRGRGR